MTSINFVTPKQLPYITNTVVINNIKPAKKSSVLFVICITSFGIFVDLFVSPCNYIINITDYNVNTFFEKILNIFATNLETSSGTELQLLKIFKIKLKIIHVCLKMLNVV